MPLISTMFRGDTALKACLTKDAAHVMSGAAGDHVAKIQTAVSRLSLLHMTPGSWCDLSWIPEFKERTYGPVR